ncbi:hypothetical protein [Mucilaginibacter ginsenosidivorax]|uniref:Uncharacterized protein n=1 Tax=Mucilaginibacter ginsenosidivorax TaxID=862126 RepID=A0A5B8W9N3_9SPHI|nr:hypothetical protein [Mucilaginibacter ginsenosidivorax]QEC78968.1 hypothetical protein FSB76_24580 [Mucilaginibacter ginsenosidivorax]
MPICALCHKNDADKKGSHLIPHFLMKKIDNVDGRPGRELELGFELSGGYVTGYFGSSVLPERLAPVFGELTEEELEKSRSKLIVDDLLCTACEMRLGNLESAYAQTLKKTSTGNYTSTEDSYLAFLFWCSIFWRMSVTDTKAYKLDETDEYHLRIILDGGLDATDIPAYTEKLGKEITGISYELIRCLNYTNKNTAKVLMKNENTVPYAMLIGEFAVFLTVDPNKKSEEVQTFLGLEKLRKEAKTNTCQQGESVLSAGNDVFDEAYREGAEFWVEDFTKTVSEICDALHKKFVGAGAMGGEIKKKIMVAIADNEGPMGRRYTPEAMHDAIMKTIVNYEPYKSMHD